MSIRSISPNPTSTPLLNEECKEPLSPAGLENNLSMAVQVGSRSTTPEETEAPRRPEFPAVTMEAPFPSDAVKTHQVAITLITPEAFRATGDPGNVDEDDLKDLVQDIGTLQIEEDDSDWGDLNWEDQEPPESSTETPPQDVSQPRSSTHSPIADEDLEGCPDEDQSALIPPAAK